MRKGRISIILFVFSVLLEGCSPPQGTAPESEAGFDSDSVTRPANPQRSGEVTKMRFLNRLREADPQYQTIERAVMNEQDELGLVLSRSVAVDDIPKLMRSILKQMAAEYPGEDLIVVAYASSNPPMKLGTARLDASTREMTYTPALQ